jgi:hypothetical protein
VAASQRTASDARTGSAFARHSSVSGPPPTRLRVNRAEHFSKQFDALAAFACPVHKSGHFRADFGVNPRF